MAGITAVYVSATSFTIATDRTADFVPGRRVRADCDTDGYKLGTVVSSSYSDPNTTVTIAESVLTSNLDAVWFGIVSPWNQGGSQAQTYHIEDLGNKSGAVTIDALAGDIQYMVVTAEITGWTFNNLDLDSVLLHIDNTGDETIAGVDDFADYYSGDVPAAAGIFTMYVYQVGTDVFAVTSSNFTAVT